MGTWGSGNFDNDGARDFVAEIIDEQISNIESLIEREDIDLDEGGESELMPAIALITLICRETGVAPPPPDQISSWRDTYLELFDEEIADLDPAEGFAEERRRVIEETFGNLLDLATQY